MSRKDGSEFWKTGLRRKLTTGEEAEWEMHLADQPEALAQFEDEVSLNRLLQQLPDAPVSTNFTARVMLEIDREHQKRSRSAGLRFGMGFLTLNWGRKLAFGSALLLVGFLSYHQYMESSRRELAESLVQISRVMPSEGVIGGFRAIEGLRTVSVGYTSEPDLLEALE